MAAFSGKVTTDPDADSSLYITEAASDGATVEGAIELVGGVGAGGGAW